MRSFFNFIWCSSLASRKCGWARREGEAELHSGGAGEGMEPGKWTAEMVDTVVEEVMAVRGRIVVEVSEEDTGLIMLLKQRTPSTFPG
tara:strand:+ start:394 stop:657 length:264 start_codon:yes stop_codon:yes gene_type:complete